MAAPLTKTGRYQIVAELGRGSMGVVYQGFDPVIGRTVAIKTMLIEGLSPAEFQEYKARFQREAQAAGVLSHPNIMTIYDFGEDAGVLYLVMEFLSGKSLQQIVDGQNILPVETIIPMYEQVCSALDLAHANKIVHRDIKPANIMILESGLIKVTDFGIAKLMTTGMTKAGQILGTPNYMSPEQVKGKDLDGRSDIFSLGVILYELVTGEKPFGGQNITTVIYKIVNENPIPPRELDATIPPGLSYVISKALAKSSDERYQTCRELAEDLKNYRNLGGAAALGKTRVIDARELIRPQVEQSPPPVVEPKREQAPPPPPRRAGPEPRPVVQAQKQVPAAVKAPKTSTAVWVLLALGIIAVGAGGGYFFLHSQRQIETPAGPSTSPTTPAQSPSSATQSPAPTQAPPTVAPQQTPPAANSPAVVSTPPNTQAKKETRPEKPETPETTGAAPKYGQLLVASNVDGARITIDGRSDSDWVTPHTFSDLTAGSHGMTVSKPGYADAHQTVKVEAGRTKPVTLQLNPVAGGVSSGQGVAIVQTDPPGIEVIIDGRSYGPSPVQAPLSVGDHARTVKCPSGDYVMPFTVKNGSISTTKVSCAGAGAVATAGTADVRTVPPGALVSVDGKPMGPTPIKLKMSAGTHTIGLALAGYQAVQKQIDVPAGQTVPVQEKLSPQ